MWVHIWRSSWFLSLMALVVAVMDGWWLCAQCWRVSAEVLNESFTCGRLLCEPLSVQNVKMTAATLDSWTVSIGDVAGL